ncbi:MAG: RsmD family RNA methyltransferase, partial [Planctomycetota bacterium]
GRQIDYSGNQVTRPMKDNIREALFNLVGGWIPGKAVFDLFSGTGAIGIEALSRGATQAFFIERHFPSIRILTNNVRSLDPDLTAQIEASDTFFWCRKFFQSRESWPQEPWVVFCSPPYDFYVDRWDELETVIQNFLDAAPDQSILVVESDQRFDTDRLPESDQWDIRHYSPAVVAVLKRLQAH